MESQITRSIHYGEDALQLCIINFEEANSLLLRIDDTDAFSRELAGK